MFLVFKGDRCFCGMSVLDVKGQNIVDGSHIKPFFEFRDDRFDNSLSLCKNHHWALDRSWFTLDEKYRIIVSKNLDEITPNNRAIKEKISLPNQSIYHPKIDALE